MVQTGLFLIHFIEFVILCRSAVMGGYVTNNKDPQVWDVSTRKVLNQVLPWQIVMIYRCSFKIISSAESQELHSVLQRWTSSLVLVVEFSNSHLYIASLDAHIWGNTGREFSGWVHAFWGNQFHSIFLTSSNTPCYSTLPKVCSLLPGYCNSN